MRRAIPTATPLNPSTSPPVGDSTACFWVTLLAAVKMSQKVSFLNIFLDVDRDEARGKSGLKRWNRRPPENSYKVKWVWLARREREINVEAFTMIVEILTPGTRETVVNDLANYWQPFCLRYVLCDIEFRTTTVHFRPLMWSSTFFSSSAVSEFWQSSCLQLLETVRNSECSCVSGSWPFSFRLKIVYFFSTLTS